MQTLQTEKTAAQNPLTDSILPAIIRIAPACMHPPRWLPCGVDLLYVVGQRTFDTNGSGSIFSMQDKLLAAFRPS
jgi:hypothetical protein